MSLLINRQIAILEQHQSHSSDFTKCYERGFSNRKCDMYTWNARFLLAPHVDFNVLDLQTTVIPRRAVADVVGRERFRVGRQQAVELWNTCSIAGALQHTRERAPWE
jgi:hypothetical protein